MLTDWLVGGLLVLSGLALALVVQVWRDVRATRAERRRILAYVRLELERNQKVANGLLALLETEGPPKAFYTISGLTNEAWRAVVANWTVARLDPEAVSHLTDAAQCASLVNTAVAAYQSYGVTQGASGSPAAALADHARHVVASVRMYLASAEKLRIPRD